MTTPECSDEIPHNFGYALISLCACEEYDKYPNFAVKDRSSITACYIRLQFTIDEKKI